MENLDMAKTNKQEDHVDRFLEEIRDHMPTLDLRVEGIVDRIAGIQRRIRRMLDETLEEHGLTSGEWHVLGKLSRSPDLRRSAGGRAAHVARSRGAGTKRRSRLGKSGVLGRGP